MELITGVGSEAHITPLHDAMWHTGIWSKDCIIKAYNDMKAEIVSNNEIRIKDGICCIQGRFSCIKKVVMITLILITAYRIARE